MIEKIVELKQKLEKIKNEKDPKTEKVSKAVICQVLIMANIAEMCIYDSIKVPVEDRNYFEGQAFIGRYFSDWGLDWIADYYYEIVDYIKNNNW